MVDRTNKVGDKVIILIQINKDDFKYYDRYLDEYIKNGVLPISGEVIKATLSDDLSYHGSPYYEEYYTIAGSDGKEYKTTTYHGYGSTIRLSTLEEFFKRLQARYDNNINTINNLNNENSLIQLRLQEAKPS